MTLTLVCSEHQVTKMLKIEKCVHYDVLMKESALLSGRSSINFAKGSDESC